MKRYVTQSLNVHGKVYMHWPSIARRYHYGCYVLTCMDALILSGTGELFRFMAFKRAYFVGESTWNICVMER